ncbi:MAG TPA: hypothetical protein VK427_27435 [Kofleriaceae bacterium]|nr:hypothetical protein [Kofleriaceae bacterium]
MSDPSISARALSARPLVYTDTVADTEDRPPHVRAASAIAARADELFVVQDDVGFIARVHGDRVSSIALPRGAGGRRRFEVALGNKLDKLDLESCVFIGDTLWAFGSGTIPIREHVVQMSLAGEVRVTREEALYAGIRDAVGGPINIEGVACVGDALWFFHRGNTSARDVPAIVRVVDGEVRSAEAVDLGRVGGVAIGFTDACAFDGGVMFIGAAEASTNAIDDGEVVARVIGVIDRRGIRIGPLEGVSGKPEGLALQSPDRAWITVDPDDPDVPTSLYDVSISAK